MLLYLHLELKKCSGANTGHGESTGKQGWIVPIGADDELNRHI
jgi:hypothetical protein